MLSSLVVALLATAPMPSASNPPGTARRDAQVPRDGHVVTPEGIRFRLPPRLTYSMSESDGQRTYVASAADGTSAVTVTAFVADSALPCEAQSEGIEVEAFRTTRGLEACRLTGEEDGNALVLALVRLKEDLFVAVNAIGPASTARAHADAVAASFEAPARVERGRLARIERPRAEPRLVGCFDQTTSSGSFVSGVTSAVWTRCFREDLTFTEDFRLMASLEHRDIYGDPAGGSSADGRLERRGGSWSYAKGVLSLSYDDGNETEWELEFGDDNVLASGRLWERL